MSINPIPEGYHLTKKGGRPKDHPRNVAVAIARRWRITKFAETAKVADLWIIEHWNTAGISQEQHVHRAIQKAEKVEMAPLSVWVCLWPNWGCIALTKTQNGWVTGWAWKPGLTRAIDIPVQVNWTFVAVNGVLQQTATANFSFEMPADFLTGK